MPAFWIPKRLVDVGLINTAAAHPGGFVSHCEIEYESRVSGAAAEIIEHQCKIVMLTGPSASGKTTTANKLSAALMRSGKQSTVVSLDNFYLDIENYPRLEDGSKDYENINALDIPLIHSCLLSLIEKGSAQFPEFDFKEERRKSSVNNVELKDGIVVVEGIHALNPILTHVLDKKMVFKIYSGLREEYSKGGQRFLPTRDIRLARRMVRDHKFRGHSLEKTLDMWPLVCEGEDLYIKKFKPYADLLLDTSFSYEICVLAPFIMELKDALGNEGKGALLNALVDKFSKCEKIKEGYIPPHSMLREFVG